MTSSRSNSYLLKVKQFTFCSHGNTLLPAHTPNQEMTMIYNIDLKIDVCDEKFTSICVYHYHGMFKFRHIFAQSSFHVIHKVDKLACLHCFNFENQMDIVISYLNFNSKHHDKCKVALKFISLATTSVLIRTCTKMPIMLTLCIMARLECPREMFTYKY